MQMLFKFYQLLAFTFLQSRNGNVRPARDDFRNVLFRYLFAKERFFCLCTFCCRVSQFPFELRYPAILNFTRSGQLTTTLCALELGAELIEFRLPFSLLVEDCFLFLPFGFERRRFFL